MIFERAFRCLLLLFVLSALHPDSGCSQPIINLKPSTSTSESYRGFEYVDLSGGSVFRTLGESVTATTALPKFVGLDFTGTLSGFSDIPSGAIILLDGVTPLGAPIASGSLLTQPTIGGSFSIWANQNMAELLLKGTLGQGSLIADRAPNQLSNLRFKALQFTVTSGSLVTFFTCGKADLSLTFESLSPCHPISKRCFLSSTCFYPESCDPLNPVAPTYFPNKFLAILGSGSIIGGCPGCDGIYNSGKVIDLCGICGGNNSSCKDCAGVPNGGKVYDRCGVCGGTNTCLDCLGVPFGNARFDRCGVCNGKDLCLDCAGTPFGGKVYDQCGVCGGNNSTCKDCAGVPNGGKVYDQCGVCGGNNSTCKDCAGVPNGGKVYDQCGVCGGNNSTCKDCAGVPNGGKQFDKCGVCGGTNACLDCSGTPFGTKKYDSCGVCGGNNSTCKDCAGVPNGGKVYDQCGVCGGNSSTCKDCAGVPNGGKKFDKCGVCGGSDACLDCSGTPFGNKRYDQCGVCGGTNACFDCSGVPFGNKRYDQCGVCGGTNSCLDCSGTPFGNKRYDQCGVCGGDNSNCKDCAGVPNGGKTYDQCGVCGGNNSTCKDCAGIPNGNKVTDICGVCGGDGSSCTNCSKNDISGYVQKLDSGADSLKKYAKSVAKLIKASRGSLTSKENALLTESNILFIKAWNDLNLSIPTQILTCPAVKACTSVSHTDAIQRYLQVSSRMTEIVTSLSENLGKTINQLLKEGKIDEEVANKRARRANALKRSASSLNQTNISLATSLPSSTQVCS